MKLLLTSAGVKNPSIHNALVKLLGKPIEESNALAISTASFAFAKGPKLAYSFYTGFESQTPMCELGWKSVGVLELAAVSVLPAERWTPALHEADVLLVNGGDTMLLHHWMRETGFADRLRSWPGVYVGLSAGSMVMTPRIGKEFVMWEPPSGGDATLGFVDFSIFPHLNNPMLTWNTMVNAERWSEQIEGPSYALDDESAISVVDGTIEIISEGTWHRL